MLCNGKLRYEIDSWDQITGCQSNNSPKLHLTYDVALGRSLSGQIIRVEHDDYGCLFSYVVEAIGVDVSCSANGTVFQLTTDELLMELEKYGFIVKFSKCLQISDAQYQLLMSSQLLGMSKIRIMYVDMADKPAMPDECYERKPYLVMFKTDKLPMWLSNGKVCSKKEFANALANGYAVNLTECEGGLHGNDWSFLTDKVLNVSDILEKVNHD